MLGASLASATMPSTAAPAESIDGLRQGPEEELTIRIDEEGLVAGVSATGHVVDGAGVLNPKWTSHGSSLPGAMRDCKT
jgi:hypothetical protein